MVGVEFLSQVLKVRVQTLTSLFKLGHTERGGVEGVLEGIGLPHKVDRGMRREGIVSLDLTSDGTSKCPSDLMSQIVIRCGILMSFEPETIGPFVSHITS